MYIYTHKSTAFCCSTYICSSVTKCPLTLAVLLGLLECLEGIKFFQVSLEDFELTIYFLARVLFCDHTLF